MVMAPQIITVGNPGQRLFWVNTDKFKFSSLTVMIKIPYDVSDVVYDNLLLSVLQRGTKKHSTVSEINKYLDSLYSMNVSMRRYSLSTNKFLGMSCEFLDGNLCFDDIDLEDRAIDFFMESMFSPLLDENGYFLADYVETEKSNIVNALKAQKNSSRS